MTDKKMRKEILRLIGENWDIYPEWRLGQLLANTIGHHKDPFYWRDEELLKILGGKKGRPKNENVH